MSSRLCDDIIGRIATTLPPKDLICLQSTCRKFNSSMEHLWRRHLELSFPLALPPMIGGGTHRQLFGKQVEAFRDLTGCTSKALLAAFAAYSFFRELFRNLLSALLIMVLGIGGTIGMALIFCDGTYLWRPYALDTIVIGAITVIVSKIVNGLFARLPWDRTMTVYMASMLWSALTERKEVGLQAYIVSALVFYAMYIRTSCIQQAVPFVSRYRRQAEDVDRRMAILRNILTTSPIDSL
jgi:F-box domain